jgi:hypothetical protein
MAQIIRQPNETDEAWAARVKQFRETQKAFVLPPPSMPEEIKQQDRRWLPIINDGVHTNIHGTEVHIPETNPFEEDEAILLPEKGGSSEKEQPKQEPVVKIESSKGGVRSAAEMDAELIRMRATLSTMQNSSQGSEQTPTGKISETVDGGGGITYDYLFVGSKKITPPERTTDFLKVNLDGSGSSWVAAMPETQDEDAVVIDVTKNRIYIHGAFGGA